MTNKFNEVTDIPKLIAELNQVTASSGCGQNKWTLVSYVQSGVCPNGHPCFWYSYRCNNCGRTISIAGCSTSSCQHRATAVGIC